VLGVLQRKKENILVIDAKSLDKYSRVGATVAKPNYQELVTLLAITEPAVIGHRSEQVKLHGQANDLMDRLKGEPAFRGVNLAEAMDPSRFVGRAPQQVDQFISRVVDPIRRRYADALAQAVELKV